MKGSRAGPLHHFVEECSESRDDGLVADAAQLALRGVIGTRELDVLLSDKDAVTRQLDGIVRGRVAGFGIDVVALGIRDVILPGEM